MLTLDELEPSAKKTGDSKASENIKDKSLRGDRLHNMAAFIDLLNELGVKKLITDHQHQWAALRSFESWAANEVARAHAMTPAERQAFEDISQRIFPEDQKPTDEMEWQDWVKLWAHWMTVHIKYLHARLADVQRYRPGDVADHVAPRLPFYYFAICECQRLQCSNKTRAN